MDSERNRQVRPIYTDQQFAELEELAAQRRQKEIEKLGREIDEALRERKETTMSDNSNHATIKNAAISTVAGVHHFAGDLQVTNAFTGKFTTQGGQTVTVKNGIIVSVE